MERSTLAINASHLAGEIALTLTDLTPAGFVFVYFSEAGQPCQLAARFVWLVEATPVETPPKFHAYQHVLSIEELAKSGRGCLATAAAILDDWLAGPTPPARASHSIPLAAQQ